VSTVLWEKLIGTIPALAWVGFATIVYFTMRGSILTSILPRLSSIKGPGIELGLVAELLDKASESTSVFPGSQQPVTATERRGVLRRLDHAVAYLDGGRILWVDDNPANNRYLIRLFEQSGMTVDLARSTGEALELLRRHAYDIVLSDIMRGEDDQAGIAMLAEFRNAGIKLPVIIHAAHFDSRRGMDPMIFAGTNRIDEVVHYVIDLMERARIQ